MMVRQMKEDAKGKSEEELAECFRIFDRCTGGLRAENALGWASLAGRALTFSAWGGGEGGEASTWQGSSLLPALSPMLSLRSKGTQTATSMRKSWLRFSGPPGST